MLIVRFDSVREKWLSSRVKILSERELREREMERDRQREIER